MWQTQIGLAQQLRDHPERWPFIVVMPQCPQRHFWTDPEMLQMAMATLEQEQHEFHSDPRPRLPDGPFYWVAMAPGSWRRIIPRHWAAIVHRLQRHFLELRSRPLARFLNPA